MNWTDCPIIEQVPGRVSGAPVMRGTRVRPEDLLANVDQGPEWLANAYSIPIEDIREVLAFYEARRDELPAEYIAPERQVEMLLAPSI